MNKLKVSVLSLSLLTVMAGAAISPALGTISQAFTQASPLLIKLIITLPALFIILTSLFFNYLITKMPPKKIALLGLILYTTGGCLAFFVNDINVLLICRAILGIGVGLIMPLSTGFISVLFEPSEHAQLMGYSSAMNNLGGIIATSLSGVLVSIDWHYAFLTYGLGIVVIILISRYLPDVQFHTEQVQNKSHTQNQGSALNFNNVKTILPFAITVFIAMVVFYALPSNFSMVVNASGIVPVSLIGVIMSIQNLAAFITGMSLSLFIKRFKRMTPLVAAVGLCIGFIFESFSSSLLFTLLGLIAIGLGLGILIPSLNAQIARLMPKEKAPAAMSIMSIFTFLGQFSSPLILDSLSSGLKLLSLQSPYYIAAGFSGLLLLILVFLPIQYEGLSH